MYPFSSSLKHCLYVSVIIPGALLEVYGASIKESVFKFKQICHK